MKRANNKQQRNENKM